jgi:hypothetical protein
MVPLQVSSLVETMVVEFVTIHHITRVGGIMIQNDGKQDVFQQLHGWIHACFEL